MRGRGDRAGVAPERGWRRARAAAATAATAARAAGRRVDAELPQRVAVRGGPRGPVHPDVPAGAVDRQGLGAAGAGGSGVDRGPRGAVGRGLDLERGRVGGLPVQGDFADRLARTEVDLEPLRVGERARPPGSRVAVDGRRGREARVLQRGRGRRVVERGVGRVTRTAAERAVDLELPQRIAPLGGPLRPVHPHVAARPGDAQGLGAAGARGGGVDRGPVHGVGRGLDLERGRVGGLPLQHDLADRRGAAEVDLEPLRVGERAGPPGSRVAVDGRRGREGGVLQRGRGGRLPLGQQGGGLGLARAARGEHDGQREGRHQRTHDAPAIASAPSYSRD